MVIKMNQRYITGAELLDQNIFLLKELADLCRKGKLQAYDGDTGLKIIDAEQCHWGKWYDSIDEVIEASTKMYQYNSECFDWIACFTDDGEYIENPTRAQKILQYARYSLNEREEWLPPDGHDKTNTRAFFFSFEKFFSEHLNEYDKIAEPLRKYISLNNMPLQAYSREEAFTLYVETIRKMKFIREEIHSFDNIIPITSDTSSMVFDALSKETWERAIKEYQTRPGIRQNAALPRRMLLLVRYLSGETFSQLEAEGNTNLAKDLRTAEEQDAQTLKEQYSWLPPLPPRKKK